MFVAGTTGPPPTDRAIVALLESAGFDVTVVDDDSLDSTSTDGYDVVYVSSSVVPNKVGSALTQADIGLVSTEAYLFDDLAMTRPGSSERGERVGTTIDIDDTGHEIAGGRAGDVVVVDEGSLSFGRPVATASVIATIRGTNEAALFAYESGTAMVGIDAPARRVGLFLTYPNADHLTSDGEDLVVRAVQWAASIAPPGGHDHDHDGCRHHDDDGTRCHDDDGSPMSRRRRHPTSPRRRWRRVVVRCRWALVSSRRR